MNDREMEAGLRVQSQTLMMAVPSSSLSCSYVPCSSVYLGSPEFHLENISIQELQSQSPSFTGGDVSKDPQIQTEQD